jgi:hypothetical protein
MQRDQKRYLLVIGVLALAALATASLFWRQAGPAARVDGYSLVADISNWQRTERQRVVQSPYDFTLAADLAALPKTLGLWVGEDVPQTNLEVFILLEPEQYVQRRYTLPDGRYVWLSLIGSRKSKSFHAPQICYDADGWRTESASEIVALQAGDVHALSLVADKALASGGKARHAVLYFYLWPDAARDVGQGTVLVKVTAPIYGSIAETLDMEKDFLRLLFASAQV